MSYILEALKKSEKERQREVIPDLQADHSPPPAKRQGRKPFALLLPVGVVLAVVAIAVLVWRQFFLEDVPNLDGSVKTAAVSVVPVREPEPELVPLITGKPAGGEPVALQAVVPEQQTPEVVPDDVVGDVVSASPAQPAAIETSVSAIPLLEELPTLLQNSLPDLHFAGHVYGDEASKRMIIINNRIAREGDRISDGLSLEEITPDGVLLRYEGEVFRVPLF